MDFNLKKAAIYKAVLFYRVFPVRVLMFYRILFFVLGLVPIILKLISSVGLPIEIKIGWSYIFLPIAFSIMFFEFFGNYYLRYPPIGQSENLADFLDFDSARIFARAFEMSKFWGETELSTKTLLLALIDDNSTEKLFLRVIPQFGLVKKTLTDAFKKDNKMSFRSLFSISFSFNISPSVKEILEDSFKSTQTHGINKITFPDILASMFDYNDEFRQFIIQYGFDRNDLQELSNWYEHIWMFQENLKRFWSLDNLLRQAPLGRSWIFGYAQHLMAFAVNLTDKMNFSRPSMRLVRRKKETEQIEQILSRSGENNVLLVGEEGVGKETIILDLAEMIARGNTLPQLNYKKMFDLNLAQVVGASKEVTDVQNLLTNIFNEAIKAGNLILVIKDFHNFIGATSGLGRIDVSEIVLPYLRSNNVQIIATTNTVSFHKFIETRSELMDVFERVNVSEPSLNQTLEILEEVIPAFERRTGAMVTYGAIKGVVEGADKFIRTSPFPEKAFDLLSETISYATSLKRYTITTQDVNEVISRKTGVPLGPVAGEEKERLIQLEEIMHRDLVGQERAVQVVASTMRRLRTGLGKRNKPAGVFLFVGPTGVGKTLTAKILAKTYFGSADRMLRFDMSEYQNIESLDRFLGSTRTGEPGQFVTLVRDNPFSLILLDELEKADKNILNIFLQVFDEGHLTDVFGRKISFEQNIIIATSNAGAVFIRELVKEGLDPSIEKEKLVDVLIRDHYFSPEFLNRFDEVVIFHPLSEEQVGQITGLLLDGLASRLKEQGYIYKPTEDVAQYVAKAGFDPQFGARPMERVIRDKVESAIAKKILDGSVRKGQEFSLSAGDL